MEKITVLFFALCALAMSNGPTREYFDAVEQSEEMARLRQESSEIISIRHVENLSCPGCYRFEVLYKDTQNSDITMATFYTRDTRFGGNRILVFKKKAQRSNYAGDCSIITTFFKG